MIIKPKYVNDNVMFEMLGFSFAFLGKMDMGCKTGCNEVSNEFNLKFKTFQIIHPGLNYRIVCENMVCPARTDLVIANRG